MAAMPNLSKWIHRGPLTPEYRQNPWTGEWVLIAPERAKKPDPMGHGAFSSCPFCEGNEAETCPETFAFRSQDSNANEPGWTVRVVPNKYPAVQDQLHLQGSKDQFSGFGIHEVVIEGPTHEKDLSQLPTQTIYQVMVAWRERLRFLYQQPTIQFVKVFKNRGANAGASLEHSHSQILAMPIVPSRIQQELAQLQHLKSEKTTLYQLWSESLFNIHQGEWIQAASVSAPRWPFETILFPIYRQASFAEITDEAALELAVTLKKILIRLQELIPDGDYNLALQSLPNHHTMAADYHWRLSIYPRWTMPAGFEWGTGMHINPIRPEIATELLRTNFDK